MHTGYQGCGKQSGGELKKRVVAMQPKQLKGRLIDKEINRCL